MRLLAVLGAMLWLGPSPVLAHDIAVGTLEIVHPSIPQPAEGATTAAVYMAIANDGEMPDRLVAVETPAAARAELHRSEVDAAGVATMSALEAIEIPAGGIVSLEPGGLHLMLLGLTGPIREGDMVPATLVFEHAGRISLEVMVDPPDGLAGSAMDPAAMDPAAMDHAAMDHGAGD